jgi:hypothetical protein
MTLDFETITEHMIEHYATMALTPGWLDYSRNAVGKLQRESPYFKDLGKLVKQRMELIYEQRQSNHDTEKAL